jgi:hypothetical protein
MLNAHTELRAKRQRSAQEAIYRNRPIASGDVTSDVCQALPASALTQLPSRGPWRDMAQQHCVSWLSQHPSNLTIGSSGEIGHILSAMSSNTS